MRSIGINGNRAFCELFFKEFREAYPGIRGGIDERRLMDIVDFEDGKYEIQVTDEVIRYNDCKAFIDGWKAYQKYLQTL